MINVEIRPLFHQYMGGIVPGLGGIALEIGGIETPRTPAVKLKATARLADVIRDLRSNSSVWAKENGIHKFAWQRRYGAFTVSESQVNKVRVYICNQEKHHQKFDFETEFERLLRSNGIPLDAYMWQE